MNFTFEKESKDDKKFVLGSAIIDDKKTEKPVDYEIYATENVSY